MKKISHCSFLFYLIIALVFSSCSTVYKNGYYQTRKYKTTQKSIFTHSKSSKTDNSVLPKIVFANENPEELENATSTRVASSLMAIPSDIQILESEILNQEEKVNVAKGSKQLKKQIKSTLKEINKNTAIKGDSCDWIVFKNGDDLKAQIIEISKTEVRFKKCDSPDGPTRVEEITDILFIKYSNGEKEVFNSLTEKGSKSSGKVGAIIFGVLSVILGGLVFLFFNALIGMLVIYIGIFLFIN